MRRLLGFAVRWQGKDRGPPSLQNIGRSPTESVRIVSLQFERETNVEQAFSI